MLPQYPLQLQHIFVGQERPNPLGPQSAALAELEGVAELVAEATAATTKGDGDSADNGGRDGVREMDTLLLLL